MRGLPVHFVSEIAKLVKNWSWSWNYISWKWLKLKKEKLDLSEVEKAKSWKFSELKTLRLILWKVENSKVEVVISWKYESWTAQVENVKLKMQKLNHHAPIILTSNQGPNMILTQLLSESCIFRYPDFGLFG